MQEAHVPWQPSDAVAVAAAVAVVVVDVDVDAGVDAGVDAEAEAEADAEVAPEIEFQDPGERLERLEDPTSPPAALAAICS